MKRPIRSKTLLGIAAGLALCLGATAAWAQLPVSGAGAPGAGSDILRIRKMSPSTEKTPIYTVRGSPSSMRQPDWWRVVVEFETAPDWIDELEFTYYVYMKDQSNRNAEVMFRGTVTYVNVARGKHLSDMFLHPSTVARMGRVEQVAVVVKAQGAVVATESTAKMPNWWDRFSPRDGVLLNRSQTPFSFVDYDSYEAIKPAVAPR